MLRDYDLPHQLGDLLDLTGYPRDLSYPPRAQDTLQMIALAEAVGARRAREQVEMDEMAPILRSLGRNNFDRIGLGGLGWGLLGDDLDIGPGLDRLYRPMLRNQGMGLDTMGDLMFPGMLDYAGMGRLGGRSMNPGWGYGGMRSMGMGMGPTGMGALRAYPGGMGRRRGLGMGGMGYGMGGMGMGMGGMAPYSAFGGGYGYRGSGLSRPR